MKSRKNVLWHKNTQAVEHSRTFNNQLNNKNNKWSSYASHSSETIKQNFTFKLMMT